ncbi:carbamoyltransferase HypF [Haloferula sp. A504]|uniref:carbamoyltransferase HypF n=1 Tax=Haloferula sp. A504 TaxID=3373601 RepID=UPI0031BFD147|nr:carbamoyltransferase HypF [Verrucomicrobiaceae bacterium E54]
MSVGLPVSRDQLLRVRGTVQGVGFRPFVWRRATELGIKGWVRNDAEGVLIRAVGQADRVERLVEALWSKAPGAARVVVVERLEEVPADPGVGEDFSIIGSEGSSGEIETGAPVDLAPCEDCRRELLDPADRRFGYAFINCTQCGPRYSIIESLPYDRPQTTMRDFTMCPSCQQEYEASRDRRFHAEPNACPRCGPRMEWSDAWGRMRVHGPAAIDEALEVLRAGGIVAVKGVGGFHLMADATNESAVCELRRRKHREEKPFGVMFADLEMLRRRAEVSEKAAALLTSSPAPMVLVPHRDGGDLAAGVAPGNPWIGALLPSAPLHLLLFQRWDRPLVATSANLSEEPLCTEDAEARERLAGIADGFLGHNRRIARPVDDSIVRLTREGTPVVLRRARGQAPSPLSLPAPLEHPLLCVGADLKNTVAVASGQRLVLSPHIGDLAGAATQGVFRRTLETLSSLIGATARAVVCDKHPDYRSTRFAEECGLPRIEVQHHLAHVLAVLLEHGRGPDGVLGVAWDGTGYGEDGTVWGGEFLLLEKGRASRFACLRPFQLPGGEAAVRDARRVALAMLRQAGQEFLPRLGFSGSELATLEAMQDQRLNSPVCTSAGRLFDAFGAVLGLGQRNRFEGQIPLAVEAAAVAGDEVLPFTLGETLAPADWEVDWRPAIESCLEMDPGKAAAALHRGLAGAIVETARRAGAATVVLSGGCFQNVRLRELSEEALIAAGFEVLASKELPPGDGAIAAGQALAALWQLTSVGLPPAGSLSTMKSKPTESCASPFLEK